MDAVFISIYHALQACYSAYAGLLSYTAIQKVSKYEEQSEKAAKYSSTVGHKLHKTRTTQTSGAIATLSSLVTSIVMTATISEKSSYVPVLISTILAGGMYFAHLHLSNYWKAQAKIPFVTDMNDGINMSNQLQRTLQVLGISWGVSSVVYLIRLW